MNAPDKAVEIKAAVTEDMLRCMIVNLGMCKALIDAIPDIDKEALFEEFKKNLKLSIEVE